MSRATVTLLSVGLLLFVIPAGAAQPTQVTCGVLHFVRGPGGTEIGTTAIGFRNTDPATSYTISRITIRDFFGNVVHDSGPATGTPHPLNSDIVPNQDITVVPPGAAFYLATNHIWGFNPIPAGNQNGFSMTGVVEFAPNGTGNVSPLLVGASRRERERTFTPTGPQQGESRTRDSSACTELK